MTAIITAADTFQSLIGILVNCNDDVDKFVMQNLQFQSLIGILVNCNQIVLIEICQQGVSIPNRDSC